MTRASQRGVSLMEAVVALAVMGFGMLGVAGMQASLRQNADIARQRAEAVRLAGDALERYRGYSIITTDGVKRAYDDISTPAANDTLVGLNATYIRTSTVGTSADFNVKTVQVMVSWTDRSNNMQRVLLASQIHRVPPELAGSLMVTNRTYSGGGDGLLQRDSAGGGSAGVPPGWLDNGNGTFSPPVTGGISPTQYFFGSDGAVMLKTAACNVFGTASCQYYRVVQGYVAFAVSGAPTAAIAENPADNAPSAVKTAATASTLVDIVQSAPASVPTPVCYFEQVNPPSVKTVGYNCLIGIASIVSGTPDSLWSASFKLFFTGLATSHADVASSSFRVCRYTRYRNDDVIGTVQAETGLALTNMDHPKLYASVKQNLVNQNFLVIRAGDGTSAYDCPDDETSTPVYGRTWQHQPDHP